VHPRGSRLPFTFITRYGFDTQTLAQMLDSLVRVSRRAAYNHYASILAEARPQFRLAAFRNGPITLLERSYIPEAFIRPPELMLA